MKKRLFGTLPDGTDIIETTLTSGQLTAKILNWGAVLQDLRLAGHPTALVLGLTSLDDYVAGSAHMGALAGRCANRVTAGQFTLDDISYQLDRNVDGINHLHGGNRGFGERPWLIQASGDDFITLTLRSPQGDCGYPGEVDVAATYRLHQSTLTLEITATTSAPTLVNLAHHSYFKLDDQQSCQETLLEIDADAVTPLNDALLPTGDVLSVAGTEYDLREERAIGAAGIAYDINYCLASMPRRIPAYAATARSQISGIALEVWTTEPGIQFYDGAKLRIAAPGLHGASYGAKAGFCLEPQRWPDAPNHRHFPSATLRPGETYRQVSEFRFWQTKPPR